MTTRPGLPSPFTTPQTPGVAKSMARLTTLGFGLSAVVSLIQSAAVWYGATSDYEPYRAGTASFAIVLAVVTAALSLWQWRRPNRILPVFGIAWALYELSAFLVSAILGAPLGAEGVPVWSSYLSVGTMAACLILHIGGLRGAAAMSRLGA